MTNHINLSIFALLLEEVGSQTVGPPYHHQYQQLTQQHGLKMDENSLHPTFHRKVLLSSNLSNLKNSHLNIEGISASNMSRLMREN
jgi:hypothetical protein